MNTTPLAAAQVENRAGISGLWWKSIAGASMAAAIVVAFVMVGPARGFSMNGQGAKIFLFHMPCAWLSAAAFFISAWYALLFLRRYNREGFRAAEECDLKCLAANELGLLFGVLCLVTGSVFSRNEWGQYWSWDPRQTSLLVVLLLFAAYLVLRGAIADPENRARLASSYALISVVPGQFLMFVLPRIVQTLHGDANRAVLGGTISGGYRAALYLVVMPAFIALFVWMFQLRIRALKLIARQDAG